MSIRFSGKRFVNRLCKSAESLEVGTDKYDRMLQSILTTVGAQENEGYETAVQTVDRLSALNVSKTVGRIVISGTGAAVLAASAFAVVMLGQTVDIPPADQDAYVNISDQGIPLNHVDPQQGVPSAYNAPALDSFRVDKQYIYIYLTGREGDPDWMDNLYGVDSGGNRVEPVETDPNEGMVKFELPDSRFELHYQDEYGGDVRIPLRMD